MVCVREGSVDTILQRRKDLRRSVYESLHIAHISRTHRSIKKSTCPGQSTSEALQTLQHLWHQLQQVLRLLLPQLQLERGHVRKYKPALGAFESASERLQLVSGRISKYKPAPVKLTHLGILGFLKKCICM